MEAEEGAEVAAEEEVLVHPAAMGDHHRPTPSGIRYYLLSSLSPFPQHKFTNPFLPAPPRTSVAVRSPALASSPRTMVAMLAALPYLTLQVNALPQATFFPSSSR